ncbi:MAG: AMP-binding protein, partial [Muribaculaceae bacterium]|nr:AMP-binding protein [Muribaculaceae bacterium]
MDKSATIYSRFLEMAVNYPDSPAVIEDDRTLTYSQLNAMADSILDKFYDRKPGYVGIVMHHGAEQIAAMLAVLKSGAAYIPAEPSLPQERIDYMMHTAGVELIITDNYCRHLKPAQREMKDRSTPDGVAYVLYTSGTSGKPKGVVVENHSVVNYAEAVSLTHLRAHET